MLSFLTSPLVILLMLGALISFLVIILLDIHTLLVSIRNELYSLHDTLKKHK